MWPTRKIRYSIGVALPVADPHPAPPCHKSPKRRLVLLVVLVLALIGGGVSLLKGESRVGLLIGVGPLLLVALVCLCDPCCKGKDHHD